MSSTPAVDVLRVQAQRAQDLFDELINLRDHLKQQPTAEPVHKLLRLINHARQITNNLSLLRSAYAPRQPKRAADRPDCPDQLPLWHDAPANLEE